MPGPVKKDTNNWAPRVGFAWNPQTNNRWFGNSETVIRGGFGIAYDVLFYNLLTVNGSNYPRIVTLDVTDQRNLYPTLLTGSATPTFNPLAAYTNSAEDTESPESRFYSLTLQRAIGNYTFEVGYSGSRGYKGINQIEMNPSTLTPEQAAAVAAAQSTAVIPTVQQRRIFPQFGSRVTDSGLRRAGRHRSRGAFRVQRDLLLGQQALLGRRCSSAGRIPTAAGTATTTPRSARVARTVRASARRACSTTRPSGAVRSSIGRTASR